MLQIQRADGRQVHKIGRAVSFSESASSGRARLDLLSVAEIAEFAPLRVSPRAPLVQWRLLRQQLRRPVPCPPLRRRRVLPLSVPWRGQSWTGGSATSGVCLRASGGCWLGRGGQSSVGGKEAGSACQVSDAQKERRRTLSIFWSSVSSAAWIPARLTLRMLAASSIVMPWFLVMTSTLPARPPEVPAAAPPAASPPARASARTEERRSVGWEGARRREGEDDSLRAACRHAWTKAFPRICEPRMTTCAITRGADCRRNRVEKKVEERSVQFARQQTGGRFEAGALPGSVPVYESSLV